MPSTDVPPALHTFGQIDAINAQAADRDAYLKLADDLEGFLAQLRGSADTATTEQRQRVLRAAAICSIRLSMPPVAAAPNRLWITSATSPRSISCGPWSGFVQSRYIAAEGVA
jgi:hypothetical protein